MPVTAKLSRKFYERFGDEIANELVEWFNAVDATYQRQLKEVNDLNWERVETRFGAFDERLDGMAERFDEKLGALGARIDAKLGALEVSFQAKLGALEVSFQSKLGALEARIESTLDTRTQRLRSELILWMFGFWTATVIPLVGLMLSLSGVFRR
ncbi:MAG: hypothetical protein Q7S20_04790 [Gemmatimonadaceae bacterium]|nr:hypothetical protein [Gemmatimonadaceae bacterium]